MIATYGLNTTEGYLVKLGNTVATTEGQANEISILNRNYLYVGHYGGNNIDFFTIGTDGSLTYQESDAVGATYLNSGLDPTGSYLYVNAGGANVTKFDIDSSGSLVNPVDTATTGGQGLSYNTVFSNDGSVMLVSLGGFAATGIDSYRFVGDGSFDNVSNEAYGFGRWINYLYVHPSLDVVYASHVSASEITQHTITVSATPSTTETASYAVDTAPDEIEMTSDGACLYSVNNTGQSVSQFSVNPSTGNLTALTPRDFNLSSTTPREIAITPNDEILIVGFQGTEVELLRINGDCSLTHLNIQNIQETGYGIADLQIMNL